MTHKTVPPLRQDLLSKENGSRGKGKNDGERGKEVKLQWVVRNILGGSEGEWCD